MQVAKRRFDFISFGAVTFIAYSINCAFGKTWITGGSTGYYYQSEISTMTYIMVLCQLLIINLFIFKERKNVRFVLHKNDTTHIINSESILKERESIDYPLYWKSLLIFCYISFGYNIIIKIGLSDFFSYSSKNLIGSQVSALFSFGIWGSILCFLHAIKRKDKAQIILSSILILITVLIGSRAYLVTVILGGIALKRGHIKASIKDNLKIFIFGGLLVLFLLMYKQIYMAVRALDFASIVTILKTGVGLSSLADIGEFRTVFSLYDYVVSRNFRLPFSDTLARILSIIPLANNYIPTRYSIRLSGYLETEMHSSYGLGGSFWGESIAMGGPLFLLFLTLIWLIFLKKSSAHISGNKDSSIFVLTSASYICFYIHRLDWIQVMGCFKSVILFYLLYFLFTSFTNKKARTIREI